MDRKDEIDSAVPENGISRNLFLCNMKKTEH